MATTGRPLLDATDAACAAQDSVVRSAAPSWPRYERARIAAAAGLPVEAIEVVDIVDSTSTALMQRPFLSGAAPPRVLVAVEQAAGRGRRGRAWLAPPQCSMALSVAIERTLDAAARPYRALPLALGVAIAERLAGFGCVLRLKWPNDLQSEGRKAAGLLVEARHAGPVERVVVGLGLNLVAHAGLSDRVGQPVAALFRAGADGADAGGDDHDDCSDSDGSAAADPAADPNGARPPLPDRSLLAGAMAAAIVQACVRNAADGFLPWRARWERLDALAGRRVRVQQVDGASLEGDACGVDDDGALVLRTARGLQRVLAGEASVRPAP